MPEGGSVRFLLYASVSFRFMSARMSALMHPALLGRAARWRTCVPWSMVYVLGIYWMPENALYMRLSLVWKVYRDESSKEGEVDVVAGAQKRANAAYRKDGGSLLGHQIENAPCSAFGRHGLD